MSCVRYGRHMQICVLSICNATYDIDLSYPTHIEWDTFPQILLLVVKLWLLRNENMTRCS